MSWRQWSNDRLNACDWCAHVLHCTRSETLTRISTNYIDGLDRVQSDAREVTLTVVRSANFFDAQKCRYDRAKMLRLTHTSHYL
jgi:hypothetical protein